MKAFILALLPGLEEETGEFFDQVCETYFYDLLVSGVRTSDKSLILTRQQVLTLLDRLSGTVSPAFFIQNIWLCMLTTPSARAPALQYLSRRLPKLSDDKGGYFMPHKRYDTHFSP